MKHKAPEKVELKMSIVDDPTSVLGMIQIKQTKEVVEEKSPKAESFRLMSWADLEPDRMKENKFSKL